MLLRDTNRMRSELLYVDVTVERAALTAARQQWLLAGTWLSLPPGVHALPPRGPEQALSASIMAAGAGSPPLATGEVRVELSYLYGTGVDTGAAPGG